MKRLLKISSLIVLLLVAACTSIFTTLRESPNNLFSESGPLQRFAFKTNVLHLKYRHLFADIAFRRDHSIAIQARVSTNHPMPRSYAIAKLPQNAFSLLSNNDSFFILSSGNTRLLIDKKMCRVIVTRKGRTLTQFQIDFNLKNNGLTVRMPYRGERFFGLGEKSGNVELTGRTFTMYNTDTYDYNKKSDPLYVSIPFYHALSPQGNYSVFVDEPGRSWFSFQPDNYSFSVADKTLSIVIFYDSIMNNIRHYSDLTGHPFMPPLWALGFQQSRYSYMSQDEVLNVAKSFRKNKLPLDVIYLDIDFMKGKRSFTYDAKRFPDPLSMNKKLAVMGIRTVAIVDPGIKVEKGYFVYDSGIGEDVFVKYRGKYYKGPVWPGLCYFPDFTRKKTVTWWGQQYAALFKLGISGFWNDMNEPSIFSVPNGTLPSGAIMDNYGRPRPHSALHNVYGSEMARATRLGMLRLHSNRRPFVLTRAGYAGLQRQAFIWTGDNVANWKHLRMNVSMVINLGLSGVPFSGADIGGYSGSPSSELFTRWIQLGVFIPFMRDHTEKGTRYQEPYRFKKNLKVIRKAMRLRYRLLPYLYTESFLAHRDGLPIDRPLWLENAASPDEKEVFMFGKSLFIAPVLYRMKKRSRINYHLPKGLWYAWKTGQTNTGGPISEAVSIDSIPVWVKGGSIIPMLAKDIDSTAMYNQTALELKIYPDSTGKAAGDLYEDDGISLDYQKGLYRYLRFSYKQNGHKAVLSVINTKGGFKPRRKYFIILLEGVQSLTFQGKSHRPVRRRVEIKL